MRGNYTVEAVFVCSLVCLILCLMLSMTLALYERVTEYGTDCISVCEEIKPTSERMRIERAAGDLWEK